MENRNDLISRSAAIEAIKEAMEHPVMEERGTSRCKALWITAGSCPLSTTHIAVQDALDRVLELPTIDAAPVVHGQWETTFGSYCTPHCTNCGWHIPYSEDSVLDARNYCPNCGAKMK